MKELDTDLLQDDIDLDALDSESQNDEHVEEPVEKKTESISNLEPARQEVVLSDGPHEIKASFAGISPERTCELAMWLFDQHKIRIEKKKNGVAYTG